MLNGSKTTISLPEINLKAANIKGERYMNERDLTDWLIECAKTFRNSGFETVAEAIEGISLSILRAR